MNAYIAYRNTPITDLSYSPAQLLQSRESRSTLAVNREKHLEPEIKIIVDKIIRIKEKLEWYDKTAKRTIDSFYESQLVYVKNVFT